jgi:hypothetical protein
MRHLLGVRMHECGAFSAHHLARPSLRSDPSRPSRRCCRRRRVNTDQHSAFCYLSSTAVSVVRGAAHRRRRRRPITDLLAIVLLCGKREAGVMCCATLCADVRSANKRAFPPNRSHGSCMRQGGRPPQFQTRSSLMFMRARVDGRRTGLVSTSASAPADRKRAPFPATSGPSRFGKRPPTGALDSRLNHPTQFPSPPAQKYITLMSLLRVASVSATSHITAPTVALTHDLRISNQWSSRLFTVCTIGYYRLFCLHRILPWI